MGTTRRSRVVTIVEDDPAQRTLCRPLPGDVRKDPRKCVIHNVIKGTYPWAKRITVGVRTIRMFDYRCIHNPAGKEGKCALCPGKCLEWATPLVAAKAIEAFDRGEDPVFPSFELRENEAIVVPALQDKVQKRRVQRQYIEDVKAGRRVPDSKSPQALAAAKRQRRAC